MFRYSRLIVVLSTSSSKRTTDADDDVIDCGRQKSLEFSNILSTIYIQRTKDQVLADELPMKDERIVFCEPSSLQKDLYRYILTLPDFRLLSESSGPCDCGKFGFMFYLCVWSLLTHFLSIT